MSRNNLVSILFQKLYSTEMLKKLDRYLITEFLPTFGLSLAVFSFVLLLQRLAKLFDLVATKGLPVSSVLELLALMFPTLLPLLLPISLLLSVLLAMGRLSSDSEITAMRSVGIGLSKNMKPVFLFSLAVFVLAAFTSLWVQPTSERRLRQALYDTLMNRINLSAEAGTFSQLSDGITLYAAGKGSKEGALKGIFLYSTQKPLENAVITAESGIIRSVGTGLALDLREVEIQQVTKGGNLQRTRAAESRITIPVPSPAPQSLKEEELPTSTLFSQGYLTGSENDSRLELQKRIALPFSCIVLGLLGASLGLHHDRSGKSRGVVLCLMLVFVYYSLHTFGLTMGKNKRMDPWLAMWLPNFVMGALALYAFLRKNREKPLPFERAMGAAVEKIHSALSSLAGKSAK